MTAHDPGTLADFDQRLAEANEALDGLIAHFREVGKTTDGPTNLALLQESFIADSDMTTVSALAAAAIRRLAAGPMVAVPERPGWLFVGDHSPAFLAALAAHLEAHEDLDVQEIGARVRAASSDA